MIAIRGMAMLCQPAKPPVEKIGKYYKQRGRKDKPKNFIAVKMVEHKKNHPGIKRKQRNHAVVMSAVAMPERNTADGYGKCNHTPFKINILEQSNSKHRQAADKQWKQSTMNGADNDSRQSQYVPVDMKFHKVQR
jgi:hypothetical protein